MSDETKAANVETPGPSNRALGMWGTLLCAGSLFAMVALYVLDRSANPDKPDLIEQFVMQMDEGSDLPYFVMH